MPEVRSPSNADKLTETPVIIVTSLRLRERPHLSVRQRRIAEFCSAEAGRERRKERRGTRKRTAVNNCTAAAAVTVAAPCKFWNPCLLSLLMEQNEEEAVQPDDVKVLFPARDILYSDSEIALLSAHSSWCFDTTEKQYTPSNDPPPSIISTRSTESLSIEDKITPRPCGRVGLVDGTGVGDRYLNKRPEDFVSSNDVVILVDEVENKQAEKSYRQVWHSLWEHKVERDSFDRKSSKTSKPVEHMITDKGLIEQITASVNNICSPRHTERKQRRGIFHPTPMTQTRLVHRSKIGNRPWGRPIHQKAPSTGTRSAQRKLSAMKDEHLVGDSESLFESRAPRMYRCEPVRKRQGVPRVVVTTASRPTTAVSPEKDVSSKAHPMSAPANPKQGNSENVNTRLSRLNSTAVPMNRPRFSVPIKASRVPMDLLFKEMNSPKLNSTRADGNAIKGLPLKYRGPRKASNAAELPYQEFIQDTIFYRDAGQSAHFSLPDRSRRAVQNSRRLYNRPNMNVEETNPALNYSTSFQADAESAPTSKNLLVNSGAPPHPKPRTSLRPQHGRFMERGPRRKMSSSNVPFLSRLYGHSVTTSQTAVKSFPMYGYSMESDDPTQPGPRFPVAAAGIPPLYHNDLPVPPHHLYDDHAVSSQTAQSYHFSNPNAPDVLISPPPNPRRRGDTLRLPSGTLDVEPSVTVFNNQCVPTVNFVPRYFGLRSPEEDIEDDHSVPPPFLHPNVTSRTFMPSVDFSRFGPPPRHPEIFPYVRPEGLENFPFAHAERSLYATNLQQAGFQIPFSALTPRGNASKPMKKLLTFGAQVPSTEHVTLSSVICGYLSSPRVETEAKFTAQQDNVNSNSFQKASPEIPAEVTKQECGINFKSGLGGSFTVAPIKQPDETIANVCAGTTVTHPVKHTVAEKMTVPTIENKEGLSSTNENDCSRLVTETSSLVERVSTGNPNLQESSMRQFGLGTSRSLCVCTHSDMNLSTVTEKSSEAQQSTGIPLTEVNGRDFEVADPRNTHVAEQEQRFQLVEEKSVEGFKDEEVKLVETVVMRCKTNEFVEDISGIQTVSCQIESSEVIPRGVSITELCENDTSVKYDTNLNERFRRLSDFRSSCTESTTYQVSNNCQLPNRKTSFTESTTTVLDAIDDRVTDLLHSSNSPDARHRFQSLVSRIGTCRHIALQCKLTEKSRTTSESESAFSDSKSNRLSRSLDVRHKEPQSVRRKDVCVQVPVLCCQSVETEPYTAEKGVPECRAGLTVRLMSAVVDVPPVVKMTENVGISTEDKHEESFVRGVPGCSAKIKDSGSKMKSEVFSSNAALSADESSRPISFDNCSDRRPPRVKMPASAKQLKRLKPFFRSHYCELANVYTIAAMHSVTLDADTRQCSTLSKEKLRSDSNTSITLHKDRHGGSCNKEWNEQSERVPKHVVYDRRVAFHPVKREAGRLCPQADSDDASYLHHEDEHSEHHRSPDVHGRFSNYKVDQPLPKDLRQSKKAKPVSRRTCHSADVADHKHPRNGGREEKAGCRRKVGEPSKVTRPSSENVDSDIIALKRKPGCAVCKKDHNHSAQKSSILKGKKSGGKTADVHSSLMRFGLSNIIAPSGSYESPNVKTESLESDKSSRTKDDRTFVNYQSTPVILVHDDFAFNQCRKHLSRELSVNVVPGSNVFEKCKRASVVNTPTVPTIFLTRAESNDISGLEDPSLSVCVPPVQIAFTSVDTALKDISVDSKLKDSVDGLPLKESNSAFNVTIKQAAPPFVDTHSKKVKDMTENATSRVQASKPLKDTAVEALSVGIFPKQLKDTGVDDCSKELEEDSVSSPTDRGIDKQTSSPKLDGPVSIENDRIGRLDFKNSPEPSIGCMFTAMRRYMKSHQRAENTANHGQPTTYWNNKSPGFRFAGIPVTHNDTLPIGKRAFGDWCKCDLSDRGSRRNLLKTLEEIGPACSRIPRRCTTDSMGFFQKSDPTYAGDLIDCSNMLETDKVRELGEDVTRGWNSSPQTKIMWQSVFQRYKPKLLPQPAPDTYMSYGDHPRFQLTHKGSPKHVLDSVSSLKYVKGVCCPESSKCRRESPEQTYKNETDKPIQAIRTLPPDMAEVDVFRMRYPRCALAFPESSVWARRRRASSVPAGEVRIRHGQCWPPDHTSPRRLHNHVRLPEDTCDRCQHRKAKQRVPSWVVDDSRHDTREAYVVDDQNYLDEYRHNIFSSHQVSSKDHGV